MRLHSKGTKLYASTFESNWPSFILLKEKVDRTPPLFIPYFLRCHKDENKLGFGINKWEKIWHDPNPLKFSFSNTNNIQKWTRLNIFQSYPRLQLINPKFLHNAFYWLDPTTSTIMQSKIRRNRQTKNHFPFPAIVFLFIYLLDLNISFFLFLMRNSDEK